MLIFAIIIIILYDTLCYHLLQKEFYRYRIVAYDGWRTFDGNADGVIKVCAVIACTGDSLATCGTRFDNITDIVKTLRFNSIKITSKIVGKENNLIVSNSLDWSLLPFNPTETNFSILADDDFNGKDNDDDDDDDKYPT